MAKRKTAPEPISDESDLSPPPESLDNDSVTLANSTTEVHTENQPAKKRKTASNSAQQATDARSGERETFTTPRRGTRTRNVKVEVKEEESPDEEQQNATPRKRQRKTTKVEEEEEAEVDGNTSKPALKGRAKKSTEVKKEAEDADGKAAEQPTKKKRKTKEEKEAEAMPLAARTVGHKLFIGAHVSSAGGQCLPPMQSYSISKYTLPTYHTKDLPQGIPAHVTDTN